MDETDAHVAVVTETWLKDGDELDRIVQDLELGSGYDMLHKNRRPGERGVAHGGVALLWKVGQISFKQLDIKNPNDYEILAAAGAVPGQRRKLVVLSCYIPPNYNKRRGEDTLEFITDTVIELKRRYHDPQILIAGDFNQWNISAALADFTDVKEVDVGNTRGDRSLDRMFVNMSRSVVEAGTLEPLSTESEEDRRQSNHRVAYCRLDLPRMNTFRWETFTYRYYNEESKKEFKAWMVMHQWEEVLEADSSNKKTEAFQATLNEAMDRFFPWKTTRRKSNDLPWLNRKTIKRIEARKRFYWSEGGKRTEAWKEEKKKTDGLIRERKKGYIETQKSHILAKDANRNFFRHVKTFSRLEKPKLFDVRDLYDNKNDNEVAEDLAEYFVRVSREFDPLEPADIPRSHPYRSLKLQQD